MSDMTPYYKEKLEAGLQYQDFIMMKLHQHGIVLQNIQSKKYQLKRENLLGMEIKFDDMSKKTGNLYFEVFEKTRRENLCFVPSGILRDDQNWLYAIGDYSNIWIFSKSRLRKIYDAVVTGKKILGAQLKEIPTSKGMIIPIVNAETVCEKKIALASSAESYPYLKAAA